MNNLRWQPHWLPRQTSFPRKSCDWWRTRDSSLGQPTENKSWLKTNINILFHFFFYFIKSQTSDSFVNHFDGHFSYLKNLGFSFKPFFSLLLSSALACPCERSFIKMHSTKSRCVIGMENIVCTRTHPCIFEPGNFTGWGSEGVKYYHRSVWPWQQHRSDFHNTSSTDVILLINPKQTVSVRVEEIINYRTKWAASITNSVTIPTILHYLALLRFFNCCCCFLLFCFESGNQRKQKLLQQ